MSAKTSKILIILLCLTPVPCLANDLDEKVKELLETRQGRWRDLNVPAVDGQTLYDLILKNGHNKALEIGTSTGHSTIWIAWALSKTGGKLITIELDSRRQKIAQENIEAAGLSDFVEFRLGNAHTIVPSLSGDFDFVFSDADKGWYIQYFKDMYPKLTSNACFTAHNVKRSLFRRWAKHYIDYIESIDDMETKIDDRGAGIAITCKR